jgi:hypothetical protein
MDIVNVGIFLKFKFVVTWGNFYDFGSDALRQIIEKTNLNIRQTAEHRWKSFPQDIMESIFKIMYS